MNRPLEARKVASRTRLSRMAPDAVESGPNIPASILALEAGVSASTASHHLSRLLEAGFVTVVPRGRHRYFALSGPRIGELIEAAARVAPRQPITSLRQGTRAHTIRFARRCYDHLAGRLGIAVTDTLCRRGFLLESRSSMAEVETAEIAAFTVTAEGGDALAAFGIKATAGEAARGCLDWTEQRHHIAGPLGRQVLSRMLELGWLAPDPHTRAVRLTEIGKRDLPARLGVALPTA